jgi:protease IV
MDSNPVPPSPPPYNPPPVIPPSPAPRPRRGRGWMVIALILLVLLMLSVLFNLSQFVSGLGTMRGAHARGVGPKLDEVVLDEHRATDKIVVVDIDGIITSQTDPGGFTLADLVRAQLKRATDDRRVRGVVLKVNSPGGEVLASDEIYRAIADFQKESGKPVVASMGSLAASGGYYVSAPCHWIVANEMTLTGSIGVILHSWNYRELMNKVGLQPHIYKSGRFKDMLSGARSPEEIPAEERQMVQALIDEVYDKFKEVVAEGRQSAHEANEQKGRALIGDWETYADGRVLSGTEAFRLGFVDQLGNFQDAVDTARKLANIREANLIQYRQRFDLSDLFRLFGQSEARVVKLDLGVEAPKLQAGQLYFLSPTVLH